MANSSEIPHLASSAQLLEEDLSYLAELPTPLLVLFIYSSSKKLYDTLVLLVLQPRGLEETQSTEHLKHGWFHVLLETTLSTEGTSRLLTKWEKKIIGE